MSNLRNILWTRKMEKQSTKNGNISVDSIEENLKKKTVLVDTVSDDNVETVVVPFYENDVVIKVSKDMKCIKPEKNKLKAKENKVQSYLVNKNLQSKRTSTYLEKFRNQFLPNYVGTKPHDHEISSMSPEVGDTDRGNLSFEEEEQNNPVQEFHNTEAYNEIYYENLLQQEVANYSDTSLVEDVCFNDDLENKCPEDNLRSVSEVSQPRRHLRRVTMEPNVNVKLGGLGPDLEMIRPQMMRARSLQRYSDKVRAANRVSIYKKTTTESKQNDIECGPKSARKSNQDTSRRSVKEEKVSYLVNKSSEKTVKVIRKSDVPKSAKQNKNDLQATEGEHSRRRLAGKKVVEHMSHRSMTAKDGDLQRRLKKDSVEIRVKSSTGVKTIETEIKPTRKDVPPIHISFLVNMENSSLKHLEEKHQQYQEMVKQYVHDYY